ncbi:MAG TPA: BlaI/MecI/CopY family transcriptional regulator [Gemmatales bacterium]|nr:BlaI/MecI/CopY family transcriptional regulator [Gemmatales bacterium]
MPKPTADVTEAELAILQRLWVHEAASMRQLVDELYPSGGASAYATVQKLLERLEAKELVRRERTDGPWQFRARVSRDELLSRRLRRVAEQLCDGSLAPVLTHLVRGQRLTPAERAELRQLLTELSQEPPTRSSGRRAGGA